MDRLVKVKLYDDKELIINDITRVDSASSFNQLKVYRGEDLITTLDKGEVRSWYIKSGYRQKSNDKESLHA
jgi:hypothetical protein